jgi:aspartyl aminopeptidase
LPRDNKRFLQNAKTERQAVKLTVELAEKKGFKKYVYGQAIKPGYKVYDINRERR